MSELADVYSLADLAENPWRGIEKGPLDYKENVFSSRAAVERDLGHLRAYVVANYPPEAYEETFNALRRGDPRVARTVIRNFLMSDEERFESALHHWESVESVMVMVVGGKGNRKTMTRTDILWELKVRNPNWNLCAVGDPDDVPEWMECYAGLELVPPYSFVSMEDLGAVYGARSSGDAEQRSLANQLPVIRHNHLKVFADVQNMALTDKVFTILADDFLLKPLGLTQDATERKGLMRMFHKWDELLPKPDRPWDSFLLSSRQAPLVFTRGVPDWWTDDLSHAFANIPRDRYDLAIERAIRLRRSFNWPKVATRMKARGWPYHQETWRRWVLEATGGVDPGKDADRLRETLAADAPPEKKKGARKGTKKEAPPA